MISVVTVGSPLSESCSFCRRGFFLPGSLSLGLSRQCVLAPGGVGLFSPVPLEVEQQLGGVELLAPRPVEALDQLGDDAVFDFQFGLQRGDPGGELFGFVVGHGRPTT